MGAPPAGGDSSGVLEWTLSLTLTQGCDASSCCLNLLAAVVVDQLSSAVVSVWRVKFTGYKSGRQLRLLLMATAHIYPGMLTINSI